MAKDCDKDVTCRLDLTRDSAGSVTRAIAHITKLYEKDFPVMPVEEPKNIQIAVPGSFGSGGEVSVVLSATGIKSDAEYQDVLREFNNQVAEHKKAEEKAFVLNRVHFVVDDGSDVERIGKKAAKVPLLIEKKRKLYVLDELCGKPMEWDKIKHQKKSVFQPMKSCLDDSLLDPFLEVYSKTRIDSGRNVLFIFSRVLSLGQLLNVKPQIINAIAGALNIIIAITIIITAIIIIIISSISIISIINVSSIITTTNDSSKSAPHSNDLTLSLFVCSDITQT